MFLLSWNLPPVKWGILMKEAGIAIAERLAQRVLGTPPNNDGYTDSKVTQASDLRQQLDRFQ